MKDRHRSTLAAQEEEFGLGQVHNLRTGYARVSFEGAHDVREGRLWLRRYNFLQAKQSEIWYVWAADTEGFGLAGEGVGSDSYENKTPKLTFLPSRVGRVDLVIQAYGRDEPVLRRTVPVKAGHLLELEENSPSHSLCW